MNKNKKYTFYYDDNYQKNIVFQFTKDYIEYLPHSSDFKEPLVKILWDDIISIELETFTIRYAVSKQIAIDTKSKLQKHRFVLNNIKDVETLFMNLNSVYAQKIKKPLNFNLYQRFDKQDKKNKRFVLIQLKLLGYSFLLLLAYVGVIKLLQFFF